MMRLERLPKDELLSHTSELISSQDSRIDKLVQQRKALTIITTFVIVMSVLS